VLDKSGAWINCGKQRIGQGRENAKQFLREHADVAAEIERRVREAIGLTAFADGGDSVVEIDLGNGADAAAKSEAEAEPTTKRKEREPTGAPAG
jgi:recombination protein RecA